MPVDFFWSLPKGKVSMGVCVCVSKHEEDYRGSDHTLGRNCRGQDNRFFSWGVAEVKTSPPMCAFSF